jgi:NAD(P)-dependent dehydrogenase (short-subunit alcohol dehydrogenase family)
MNAEESESVVLLTGASSGLGLALARRLVRTRHRLILTARAESLARFAAEGLVESERVWLRPLDVTVECQRQAVVAEAERRWGGVDILLNNAGVAYRSAVEHFTEQDDLEEMNVNFFGPMGLIQLVLPSMRAKRRGRLINISSVGGMMAMPTMALYSASKFALEGACESLWYEVRPWNIRVTLVEPGFIRSDSFQRTRYTPEGARALRDPKHPYHEHYRQMDQFITRLMQRTWATPDTVARTVLRVMRRRCPPLRVPATLDAHLFSLLRRVLPRGLYHRLLNAALPGRRLWASGVALIGGGVGRAVGARVAWACLQFADPSAIVTA